MTNKEIFYACRAAIELLEKLGHGGSKVCEDLRYSMAEAESRVAWQKGEPLTSAELEACEIEKETASSRAPANRKAALAAN